MIREERNIGGIPAILWGESSDKIFLYLHGQGGCKEEAEFFSDIACGSGWQVISIDLPEHGQRKADGISFDPWHVIPELRSVMEYVKERWNGYALYGNSIGAWFGMMSLVEESFRQVLFVSPVLDMENLIGQMIDWAGVDERKLASEGTIPTSFGQTLSWEYLEYVRAHPITTWNPPTSILYAAGDHMIKRQVVDTFAEKFNCELTVMEDGEHWFHTRQQMDVLGRWIKEKIRN